jgi:uncharacterized membrane protein
LIGFFGFLFGHVVVAGWLVRRRLRKFGLFCSYCDKIVLVNHLDLVTVSGRCVNCGSVLFEDS